MRVAINCSGLLPFEKVVDNFDAEYEVINKRSLSIIIITR